MCTSSELYPIIFPISLDSHTQLLYSHIATLMDKTTCIRTRYFLVTCNTLFSYTHTPIIHTHTRTHTHPHTPLTVRGCRHCLKQREHLVQSHTPLQGRPGQCSLSFLSRSDCRWSHLQDQKVENGWQRSVTYNKGILSF